MVASALVLVLTGSAWGLFRDITAGITTTDVITGSDDDGADNILLVGVDSRTDAQGNPLPPEVLRESRYLRLVRPDLDKPDHMEEVLPAEAGAVVGA